MIQLALFLFFLACIGVVAAWMAENPGHVTMTWFDYQIETSFAFIVLAAALSALALACFYLLFHRLVHAPDFFSRRRTLKMHQKGLTELTHGIVALAAADTKNALTHTRKAEKLLGRTPLTLLLSAQVARTQGDDARTQMLLEQMLEHKETEYLAARYLSESASKQQHLPKAREMAQRAHKLNPQGLDALLSLHIRLGEWQQAMSAIAKALRKGQITRAGLHRYKGLVHAQHALQLMQQGQDEAALATAKAALKQLPSDIAVIQVAARAYITSQQSAQATKLLTAAWKKQPHIALVEPTRNAMSLLPKEKQVKLAKKMAAAHPSYASHILLAQTYLAAGQWREARTETRKALDISETALACKLMAEIEMAEFADYDAHGRWLGKSANATADAGWVCNACGHGAKEWEAHCPSCKSFDALEWKQRDLTFVGAA